MRKRASGSRLSRRLERQSKRNLFLSIVGILITFFLAVKFGIPLLVNFSLFISGSNNSNLPAKRSTASFLPSPILISQFTATNSARIYVPGTSSPEIDIEIYHDGRLIDKIQSDKNGAFSFEITLNSGANQIKVKAKKDMDESDYSNILTINYNNNPPKLDVNSPSDGQSFPKHQEIITVSGNTDENVRVTVNGFWAIINENNNFSYELKLSEGENIVKIEAIDQSGNKTMKELKITRSQ
ncbi:MAG: hypothetical protein HYT08_00835 [Candidatus Levybacteria bacterium]|nr:hypothetical protein [Candidatus Levybacteria bacterium]